LRRIAVAPAQEAQAAHQGRDHAVADATGAGRARLMPESAAAARLDAAVAAAFAPDGPLARSQPGFVVRSGQREMALAVAAAIASASAPACAGAAAAAAAGDGGACADAPGGTLVAEAGTGTGKTFAYLVPALLSGGRVLISTGTR